MRVVWALISSCSEAVESLTAISLKEPDPLPDKLEWSTDITHLVLQAPEVWGS